MNDERVIHTEALLSKLRTMAKQYEWCDEAEERLGRYLPSLAIPRDRESKCHCCCGEYSFDFRLTEDGKRFPLLPTMPATIPLTDVLKASELVPYGVWRSQLNDWVLSNATPTESP